jgi:competence protein ComEC
VLVYRLPALALAFVVGTLCDLFGSAIAAAGCIAACALLPFGGAWRVALIATCLLGIVNANVHHRASYDGPPHFIDRQALVTDVERAGLFGTTLTARASDGRTYLVSTRADAPALGAIVRVHGRLEAFDLPRNPGEASMRELMAERGLYARIDRARIEVVRDHGPIDVEVIFARLRAWASAHVRDRIAEPDATILAGALWGERGSLPPDVRADFQATGTMHVLVTAGLHVGIIAALTLGLLRAIGSGRVAGALATIPVVWVYAAISGAHLPSLRAATMASFILIALAAGRRARSWNALAAAAMTIAILWPDSIGTLSFALSFSCVAAIFLFAKPIARCFKAWRVPEPIAEAIALTLSTQAGTWPLTASAFSVVAPYAPIANAAIVPLAGAAIIGGVAVLAAAPFPPLATILAVPEATIVRVLALTAHGIAMLPFSHATIATPPVACCIAYDVLALAAAALFARDRPRGGVTLLVLASALVLAWPRGPFGHLEITVLDVGQGDGIVIQSPHDHTILIDAGGRLERGVHGAADSLAERAGERIVLPFLQRRGIKRIDVLILTHAHGDHVGGCAPILRTITVDEVIARDSGYSGFAFRDCLRQAAAGTIPLEPARRGMHWTTDDGVRFTLLAPFTPPLANTEDDENENSAVVLVEYAGRRILLMGDAGEAAESRLLQSGDDLRADVLKVGHHGSATGTSAAFVRAVGPRYAVISVGRDNTFGHPAPVTIATLRAAGIEPARTDCDGAVTIAVAGDGSLALTPFLSRDEACGG